MQIWGVDHHLWAKTLTEASIRKGKGSTKLLQRVTFPMGRTQMSHDVTVLSARTAYYGSELSTEPQTMELGGGLFMEVEHGVAGGHLTDNR